MNIKCQFIEPQTISNINCLTNVDCCKCINKCVCHINHTESDSMITPLNEYCETLPNKMICSIEQKREFNPISSETSILQNSTESNLQRDNKPCNCCNNTKRNSDILVNKIQCMPYRLDHAINICKNNTNYDNYMNNRRKNRKLRNIDFKNKLKYVTDNISNICNGLKNLNDKSTKMFNCIHYDICHNPCLHENTDNCTLNSRKKIFNSINPSYRKCHNDAILRNNRNYSYNNTNDRNETLTKIIIDKEIRNKSLEEEINKCKQNYNNLKDGYDRMCCENENLKRYQSDIILLNKRKKEDEEKCKELENDNRELLNRIKKLKNMEINYNSLRDQNLETKNENCDLKNKMKIMKNDYQKIMSLNDECKDNFNSIVSKYNDLLDKYNDLIDENKNMKQELTKLRKKYDKLKGEYNDTTQENEECMQFKKKYNDLKEKYNSLQKERKSLNEINKDYESELNDLNQNNDINLRNIDNLKNRINMLKTDYNELNKKYLQNQKKLNDFQTKYKELENLYQKTIKNVYSLENEKNNDDNENKLLKKEILSLKKKIEMYEKELEGKKNDNKKRKSFYEDEIVIINKEFTINKDIFGSKINNSIKKEINSKESEFYKYHEIIQELTNMILIYEYFIFNKKIKPKNNHELLCFIIAQNIAKKIRDIRINTFVRLIMAIYKNNENKNTKKIKINNYLE